MGQARRRDLFKSDPEIKADTLRRCLQRGRASLSEAAIILGWSQPRVRAYCDLKEIQTLRVGARRYILLPELERWRGIKDA